MTALLAVCFVLASSSPVAAQPADDEAEQPSSDAPAAEEPAPAADEHRAAEESLPEPAPPPGAARDAGPRAAHDGAANAARHTAASVDDAPRPGEAANRVHDATDCGDGIWWVPRVLLFLPRWTLEVIDQPVRGAVYAWERYRLPDRFYQLFFDDSRTYGVYPVAFFETGFGFNGGLRFVHLDLGGEQEALRVRAGYGGRFEQLYEVSVDSGERWDGVELELEGAFRLRPKDRFYGIGNTSVVTFNAPEEIDPITSTDAVESRFRQRVARVGAAARWRLLGPLAIRGAGAYLHRRFDDSDSVAPDRTLTAAYQEDRLFGFEDGVDEVYGELAVEIDARRVGHWEPAVLPSAGWLLGAFAGVAQGVGAGERARYLRWGGQVQRYFRLTPGPRILALRAYAEGVVGGLGDVPFSDLPRLGGEHLLRGYYDGRFRDRIALVASAEYQWRVNEYVAARLFVDTGRVYRSLSAIDAKNLRLGYGAGLQLHTRASFLADLHVASSIDGGLILSLELDPAWRLEPREERE